MKILYKVKVETGNDEDLIDYVSGILMKKRYFFETPIRPCDFLFNYVLNNAQKKLYIAFGMESERKECPICYENLTEYNTVKTSCGHEFCKDCMSRVVNDWFAQRDGNPSCPCCRGVIDCYKKFYVESMIVALCMSFYPYMYYYMWDMVNKMRWKVEMRKNARIGGVCFVV
jgi:hypothetical protein